METKISIYFDVVCPWCYIGKKKLEDAIGIRKQSHLEDSIQVKWKTFQLDPDLPMEGEDRELYLTRKFGSMDRVNTIIKKVEKIAKGEGLPFSSEQKGRQPNTFLLHALVRKAEEIGKDSDLVEIFFRNFFAEGKNLSDSQVILDSLNQVGMGKEDLNFVKQNEGFRQEIRKEELDGRRSGVSDVPYYLFNEKYAVSGTQESSLFLQLFDHLEKKAQIP
ncbi:DsbA family oxidoreductase [Leptospira sp. WS92.C1]